MIPKEKQIAAIMNYLGDNYEYMLTKAEHWMPTYVRAYSPSATTEVVHYVILYIGENADRDYDKYYNMIILDNFMKYLMRILYRNCRVTESPFLRELKAHNHSNGIIIDDISLDAKYDSYSVFGGVIEDDDAIEERSRVVKFENEVIAAMENIFKNDRGSVDCAESDLIVFEKYVSEKKITFAKMSEYFDVPCTSLYTIYSRGRDAVIKRLDELGYSMENYCKEPKE